jgi:hypothetical protein
VERRLETAGQIEATTDDPLYVRCLRALAWDGALPLFVVAVPAFVKAVFPGKDVAEVVAMLFVPIAAALVRASAGWHQIVRVCHGRTPWWRQLALAAAIVLLLLFEVAAGMLTTAKDEPASVWLFPAVLYVAYIALISLALQSRDEGGVDAGS